MKMDEYKFQYKFADLNELAEIFKTYASDQIGSMRWQQSARAKRECEIRAEIWRAAENMLRNTILTGDK